MEIIKLHPDLIAPKRGTVEAAGYDLFMPSPGDTLGASNKLTGLGFAAKVPVGHVALILPRSSAGVNLDVRLGNTAGVIDSDYEGEWKANIRQPSGDVLNWGAGDRLLQFIIVPISTPELKFVEKFSTSSERGIGGFGSTNDHGYLPVRTPDSLTGFSFIRVPLSIMSVKERGWYDEYQNIPEAERRNPVLIQDIFEKWFGTPEE